MLIRTFKAMTHLSAIIVLISGIYRVVQMNFGDAAKSFWLSYMEMAEGLISSILSLFFSSAAFYMFHLQNELTQNGIIEFDHYNFLYFITLVVVSLGFPLILEMMRPQRNSVEMDKVVSTLDKIRYFFAIKIRYLNLLFNISRNGLLRSTFQSYRETK